MKNLKIIGLCLLIAFSTYFESSAQDAQVMASAATPVKTESAYILDVPVEDEE